MAEYPDSYYAASANPAPERPPLEGERDVEVCIVGAGFTGLSAGLELAERGHEVVVLEGAKVGWGASGRNGGQIVNGLNASLETIEAALRAGAADFVGDGGAGGRADHPRAGGALRDRLRPEGRQRLRGLHRAGRCASSRRSRRCGGGTGTTISRCSTGTGVRRHVASEVYLGGMLDRSGGHMHPLNLALGQAAALEGLGGVIHEASPVMAIEDVAGRPVVRTARGAVRPEALILAGNAYLGHLVPELENRVMPFSTQIIATEPLGARGAAILPTDVCVEDVRYVLDYYRLSADGRLLFGGGTVYGGTDPADIRAKLVPNLERVFPAAQGRGRRFRLVGELRHLVQPGAADGAAGRADLLRAGLQRARGGGEPSLRADPGGSGGWRPGAVRRFRGGALDSVSRGPPVGGALFRSRIVVVWLARPPRRVNESAKGCQSHEDTPSR